MSPVDPSLLSPPVTRESDSYPLFVGDNNVVFDLGDAKITMRGGANTRYLGFVEFEYTGDDPVLLARTRTLESDLGLLALRRNAALFIWMSTVELAGEERLARLIKISKALSSDTREHMAIRQTLYDYCDSVLDPIYVRLGLSPTHSGDWREWQQSIRSNPLGGPAWREVAKALQAWVYTQPITTTRASARTTQEGVMNALQLMRKIRVSPHGVCPAEVQIHPGYFTLLEEKGLLRRDRRDADKPNSAQRRYTNRADRTDLDHILAVGNEEVFFNLFSAEMAGRSPSTLLAAERRAGGSEETRITAPWSDEVERTIILFINGAPGSVTASDVARHISVSSSAAKAKLDDLATRGVLRKWRSAARAGVDLYYVHRDHKSTVMALA